MKKLSLLLFALLVSAATLMAQRTVSGIVTDEDGTPLIGANVLVKGTTIGTITDIDGTYTIVVPEGYDELVVTYTGYGRQEVALGASDVVNVSLSEGVVLEEAVVTALGITRDEKSLGYASQEVGGDIVESAKETNIVNALQGRVAGVQIQGSPSSMGGSSRITIRGASSFLGQNQPLFVVDGVPLDNSNFATNRQSRGLGVEFGNPRQPYDYGNTAQDIDPQNIESISVHKGAAASALYGQRGANGVILITTKSGKGQKGIGVEVNSSITWDEATNLMPHQQEYGGGATNPDTDHGFNEVIVDGQTYLYPSYSKDGSWGPKYEGQLVRHWDSWDPGSPLYEQTRPWQEPGAGYEEFFETGQTLTNSVALTGGNDQGSFRVGYTNLDQSHVMPGGELDRNTITLRSDYNLTDWLNVEVSGNYVRTDADSRTVTGYNNGNPMQAFTQWWQTQLDLDRLQNDTRSDGFQQTWNPRGPQRDADGNLLFFDPRPNFFDNPYWARENYLQEDTRNRFFGMSRVTIDLPVEGLSLTGQAGTDFYQFSLREGIPIASVDAAYYTEAERRFQETNLEARLNYNNNFGAISLNAMVGTNRMRQFQRRTTGETSGGLLLEGFFNLSNSASSPIVETYEEDWGINSVFASASLGFNDWVYVDLTARNDWSSTLPEDENSYFYPSASVSFVLSELAGIGDINGLSFLKLRASYAQVGNDAAPYSLANVFEPLVPNLDGFARYKVPDQLANADLKPELTSEYEVGLDVRFWNDRIGVDVAYYDRTTTDQIFQVPSSATTGYRSRFLNAGEMRNWGYELQLNVTPIVTRDWRWDIGLNAFRQYNEVVELTEGVESISRGGTWAADLRIQEGEAYMGVFGQDYVYHENGERLVDENGYYVTTPTREFLGSAIADWVGGLNTAVTWKNLTASALIDFQEGGIIHSTSLQWAKYSGMHPETVSFNGTDDIRADGLLLPGVKADGTPNDIRIDPQRYYQSTFGFAAPNVYDASFVKLREVRLSYKVPTRFFGNSVFRSLNVSLFGRNLAILSADLPYLDPQITTSATNDQGLENAQVPSIRSFGVNLQFKL